MDVRLVRPTDVPLALALSLDVHAQLVQPAELPRRKLLTGTLLRAAFPLLIAGRAWVARDRSSVALLEAVPRRYVIGWDVTMLAARGEHEYVLGPVVAAATDHLRNRGVPRLFARCSDDAVEELKTVAFHPLAREYVLVGPQGVVGGGTVPDDSRYRMPQDAWPLHQLESEVTPPLVRQLEGLTSLEWSRRLRGMQEIVVERDGRVVCWIGWGLPVGQGLRQIGMLVHPDHADVAGDLLQHVLQREPGTRFLARVRDYQHEVLAVFADCGFSVVDEQVLMIKHARVETARVAKSRIQVVQVPTAHIFHRHRPCLSGGRASYRPAFAGKEDWVS